MAKKKKPYPVWVCDNCANNALAKDINKNCKSHSVSGCATYHTGKCDICGETKPVTEPRDFGYPVFDNQERR